MVSTLSAQQALWKYASIWYGNVGKKFFAATVGGEDSYAGTGIYPTGNTIYYNAVDYANSVAENGVTNNTNTSSVTVKAYPNDSNLLMVGPFNFSFSNGWFDSITLTGDNGTTIPISGYAKYSGSSVVSISTPTSGQNFYVVFSPPSGVSKITKLTFKVKASVKTVTFSIYTNTGEQDLLVKETSTTTNQEYSAEVTLNVPLVGDLSLVKVDEVTGEALANVGFTIRNTTTGQYLSKNSSGNATYSDTAVELYTDSNGKIEIANVLYGTYEVVETQNPNYGYFLDGELPKTLGTFTINAGQEIVVTETNYKRLGNIAITKVDEVTGEPLAGVGFTIQMLSGEMEGKYVSVGSDGVGVYSDEPVTVYTDENGQININDVWRGDFELVEVENPNYGYYLEEELPVSKGTYTITEYETITVTATNLLRLGSIEITKVDETTGAPLEGVGFTFQMVSGVKEGQYVSIGSDGVGVYSDEPVTLYTDEDGKIVISDIWEGEYELVEVENPNYGYYTDEELPVSIGTYEITAYETITVTETNLRRWIKLSGIVWEDMISGKTSTRDGLYTAADSDESNPDRLVANVTVKLKDANGNEVSFKTSSGETVTEILTDENGYYQMCDVEIEKLSEYYIEFTYNGMSYEPVPIVDLSSTNEYSSKASENTEERTEFNRLYSEITHSGTTDTVGQANDDSGNKTYDLNYDENQNTSPLDYGASSTLNYGANSVYGYDGQNFPVNMTDEQYIMHATTRDAYLDAGQSGYLTDFASVDEIRSGAKEEIEYINLGIQEREQPDLAVVEDIESAKLTLNGYEHTYYYNQRFTNQEIPEGFDTGVKFANEYGTASYTRTIYSSDVVYNQQVGGENGVLGVYITYKVALRNESTSLYTTVNEVVNYFDNRYDVYSITDADGNALSYTVDQSYNSNGFRKVTIQTDKDISYQQQTLIYITYKLQNDAVNAVLNQDITLDSVTEITSYSTYSDSNFSVHYAGVDKDSRPGSAIPENANNESDDENLNTYEDDTDAAPSLILVLNEEEGRVISGTVWEDDALEELLANEGYDKERKGNGIYESDENVVQNVTVELLTCDDDGNPIEVASLYRLNEAGEAEEIAFAATTQTDENGNYEFTGIIPGKYLIRYTYGNSSIIVSPDGTTQNLETEKYKSTIYRGGDKDAAESMTNYWYRSETSGEENVTRLSDAKDETGIKSDGTTYDIVEDRTTEKTYTYGSIQNEENPDSVESIEATTRMFEINLDYDVNLDNISQYGDELKFVFDNIDFGIIRRPVQNLDVRKEIAYIQVTLANGQVVIEGDPREGEIDNLRYLPDGNVHIELDTEIIQGATITVTYEIIVDNRNAEIDYNDEDYYIYGIVPTNYSNWKLATISKLYDYLSNELVFDETNANNSEWTQIIDITGQDLVAQGILSQEAYDAAITYNQVLQTEAFSNMEPGQEVRVTLEVSRVLSNTQDDFLFENDIEVIEVTGRRMEYDGDYTIPGNYVPTESPRVTGYDDDYVYITITGPTGENREYLPYIILGIIGFVTIAGGIIIIKKKVL